MNSIFPAIRETGRLTCVWVPTGNPKSPLACVWMEVEPSYAASTTHVSANSEAGRMRLCA
jgi:hypothetical protein